MTVESSKEGFLARVTTDEAGSFSVPATSDADPTGYLACANVGQAVAMAFCADGVQVADDLLTTSDDGTTTTTTVLTLSEVLDLAETYGDGFLADAAYALAAQRGLLPEIDVARAAVGEEIVSILIARLSANAQIEAGVSVGPDDVGVVSESVVCFSGNPSCIPSDQPVFGTLVEVGVLVGVE